MYCGENEFEKCIESVAAQRANFYYEQVFIKNKANAEAHNELYKTIMLESDYFDYFIKLDADMIFQSVQSLQALMEMAIESQANIFSIPVHDHMTDEMIWGLNVYKKGTKWVLNTNQLFTDQLILDGSFSSFKKNLDCTDSLVSHAANPGDFQAFIFGVHRATKVIQLNTGNLLLGHSWGQLNTLYKMRSAYIKNGGKSRAFGVIGAYYTFKGITTSNSIKKKEDYRDDFNSVSFKSDLRKALNYFSKNKILVLIDSVGSFRLFLGALLYVKRKILW